MKKISTKQIVLCGFLTTIMFIIGFIVITFSNITGKSILQFSDIIFLSLFKIINPLTLITSSVISGILIDLYSGGIIFIPITIIIKILIGVSFLFFRKIINQYFAVFICYLWILLYVAYVYLLFDLSAMYLELIIDSIQYIATTIFTFIFFIIFDLKNR
ncbi:ECF transporter S component family protein [Spiroplasma taiwanense]|uniref:Rod shape-determining protein MreD n=1 Tax=Spiroplasma taiwanense CT-1 TaxID=1276220 RepID=S5MD52_9MOLU|nr:hypothetical protein [Spiroplasma taiwanense]AGR41638.1 hypothetical protein STAIW_v1c10550 [Spiroplasma taiwanense CT-1]